MNENIQDTCGLYVKCLNTTKNNLLYKIYGSCPFNQPNYFKISNEFKTTNTNNCKGPSNFFKNVYQKKKM